jgi:hypothetical protein
MQAICADHRGRLWAVGDATALSEVQLDRARHKEGREFLQCTATASTTEPEATLTTAAFVNLLERLWHVSVVKPWWIAYEHVHAILRP